MIRIRFCITFFMAFLFMSTASYSQAYYCCPPDDCDDYWWSLKCEIDCSYVQTLRCTDGENWVNFRITCFGRTTNWQHYPTNIGHGPICVKAGNLITCCTTLDDMSRCEDLPEGEWRCIDFMDVELCNC